MIYLWRHSKITLVRSLVEMSPNCLTVSILFYWKSLLKIYFAEPNCLDCIIFDLRSKLWRQSLGQHQCSQIDSMNGDIYGRVSNWKISGLSQRTNHVNDRKQLSAAGRTSYDLGFHHGLSCLSLKFRLLKYRTLNKSDDESHATLSAYRIGVVLMTTLYGYASILQTLLDEFITIPWSEVCLR